MQNKTILSKQVRLDLKTNLHSYMFSKYRLPIQGPHHPTRHYPPLFQMRPIPIWPVLVECLTRVQSLTPLLSRSCCPRPGCSKLTTSLVNVLLIFQMFISQICQYFLLKNCEQLLQCKSFSHFFQHKISDTIGLCDLIEIFICTFAFGAYQSPFFSIRKKYFFTYECRLFELKV